MKRNKIIIQTQNFLQSIKLIKCSEVFLIIIYLIYKILIIMSHILCAMFYPITKVNK